MLVHVNGPKALRYPSAHGLAPRRAEVARAERRDGAWASVRRRAPPDALRGVATRAGPKAGLPRDRHCPVRWPPEGPAARKAHHGCPSSPIPGSLAVVTRGRYTRPLHVAVTRGRYTRPLHTVVTHGRHTRALHATSHSGVTRGRHTRSLHTDAHTVVTRGRYIRSGPLRADVTCGHYARTSHTVVTHGHHTRALHAASHANVTRGCHTRL